AFTILILVSGSGVVRGQGGTGREPTPSPSPSTKQPVKSNQPVKRVTTPSRGSRSTSTASETENSSATLDETLNWIGERLATPSSYESITIGNRAMCHNPGCSSLLSVENLNGSPAYKIDGCTVTMDRIFKIEHTEGK